MSTIELSAKLQGSSDTKALGGRLISMASAIVGRSGAAQGQAQPPPPQKPKD